MWHEARKQEKKLRDVMINYQKRAERRKQHYEKMVSQHLIHTYNYDVHVHVQDMYVCAGGTVSDLSAVASRTLQSEDFGGCGHKPCP